MGRDLLRRISSLVLGIIFLSWLLLLNKQPGSWVHNIRHDTENSSTSSASAWRSSKPDKENGKMK